MKVLKIHSCKPKCYNISVKVIRIADVKWLDSVGFSCPLIAIDPKAPFNVVYLYSFIYIVFNLRFFQKKKLNRFKMFPLLKPSYEYRYDRKRVCIIGLYIVERKRWN